MAARQLKLGIIGVSDGNGHPYSWSAICNGYNAESMKECPFPVIPEYLGHEKWPEAQIKEATVSHIWTQNKKFSKHIASAALIPDIVDNYEDLITEVDAIFLARDDAENHLTYATPFLQAGLPIFVDKPLALNVAEAEQMIDMQQYDGQLFSCSSLRFAKELYLNDEEKEAIGGITFIEGQIPKSWEKYVVHIIEPIVVGNPKRGELLQVDIWRKEDITKSKIVWKNLEAHVSTYGNNSVPLEITYFGKKGNIKKKMSDTFSAFKTSIQTFIESIQNRSMPILRKDTLEIVEIIERGINA